MEKEINRTQLNSIANKVKKVLKKGIKEGKSVEDIICSSDIEDILGYYSATEDGESTQYDFDLGEFGGRITRTDLSKEDAKYLGCSRINTNEIIFTIEENFEENNVTAFASVRVDWCDKYGKLIEEFVTIKEWELIEGMEMLELMEEMEMKVIEKTFEEVKKDLLGKEVRLQDMEVAMYQADLVYDEDFIYEKEVLEEKDFLYTIKFDKIENYDTYIYVEIEFTEKNEKEPWYSYVIVKDMYIS